MTTNKIREALAPLFVFCSDSYKVESRRGMVEITCDLLKIPEDLEVPIIRKGMRQSIKEQIVPFVINNVVKPDNRNNKNIKIITNDNYVIVRIPKRLVK